MLIMKPSLTLLPSMMAVTILMYIFFQSILNLENLFVTYKEMEYFDDKLKLVPLLQVSRWFANHEKSPTRSVKSAWGKWENEEADQCLVFSISRLEENPRVTILQKYFLPSHRTKYFGHSKKCWEHLDLVSPPEPLVLIVAIVVLITCSVDWKTKC